MIKRILVLIAIVLALGACSKDHEGTDNPGSGSGDVTGGVTNVTPVVSDLTVNLTTDKACYNPGEKVHFTADNMPSGAKIRYRSMNKLIDKVDASGNAWAWTAPATDFTGYLVDVYRTKSDGTEVILGTIAVDVSSDWTRFPRYGFVATFGAEKTIEVIQEEMTSLNRYHINGVQFQDWHNKHHWPLGGTRDHLKEVYKDIANRDVYTNVVKNYIAVQHNYGMKSMFYNLCYGALDDAASDGVKEEWYIYKGTNHSEKDYHDLPSSWKSDIYLLDPANKEWQAYMAQRNDDVYVNFDFDGYQIDQLGNRGDRYDYNGNKVNLPKGYASFIEAMKAKHPQKRLVMNAVAQYGASQIAGTGDVDFLYNEVWGDEANYNDLRTIIRANDAYSNHSLKTVFAAYMNYNMDNASFNTSGVLLTDAVMFALGGSHLELGGDHMLCREYFPYAGLKMTDALKTAMIHYYDFMTAYQNLLRGGGEEQTMALTTTNSNLKLNAWPPQTGAVTAYAKMVGGKQVIHLLNFRNADSTSWRDTNGTMPEPALLTDISFNLSVSGSVSRVWVASPDQLAGASQELAFEQKNDMISFVLPSLKYWTMIVVEYK